MIQIVCTQCQQTLEIDDGFAGGVCRCQFCGTIQTVPKQMAAGSRPRAPGSQVPQSVGADTQKSLYQVRSRAGMSSHPSGLEELAEIVHSSGLAGSGLSDRTKKHSLDYNNNKNHPKPNNNTLFIGITVGAVLVLMGVLMLLFFGRFSASAPVAPVASGSNTSPTTPTAGNAPAFAELPLTGDKIVYLLDRGDATSDYFGALRELTQRSIKSLGGDRRFQVALWTCNNSDDSYPRNILAYANKDEIGRLIKWFDDVPTGGQTSVDTVLQSILKQEPDVIILATGKAWQLDSTFADKVLKMRGKGKTIIHTITLGDENAEKPLAQIAKETGGQHFIYSQSTLKTLAE